MKCLLLVSVAMMSQIGLGAGFPQGKFSGEASWKSSDGKSGSYGVSSAIVNSRICSSYQLPGNEEEFCFEAKFADDGFFTVENGWGYCYDYQCHYQVDKVEGAMIEETLSFVGDKLYKVGSKTFAGGNVRIVWQEALTKVVE